MCAFILNGFRLLFFIQIDYLKTIQLYFYHAIEVLYVWF